MCNTFGGIMFIAISLIVLSQLITQQQKTMSQEDISQTAIENLKKKIEIAQNENIALSKAALEASLNTANVSPEKKEAIMKLKEVRKKNLILEDSLERLNIKVREQLEIKKHRDETLEKLTAEVSSAKRKLIAEKQKNQQEKRILEEKIRELNHKLNNVQQPTLRFSKLKETELKPYWVLFQRNRIYRLGDERNPLKNEVEMKLSKLTRSVTLIPLSGTAIGSAPEEELDYLFKNVDRKKYFINILSDSESFSTLMVSKQFFRNHKYLCDWSINPEFETS